MYFLQGLLHSAVLKQKYKPLFLLIFLKILLEFIYVEIISSIYSYSNLIYEYSFENFLLSYICLFALFPFIPLRTNKISEFIIQYFFILTYIPLSAYFAYSGQPVSWFLLFNLFWLIILLAGSISFNVLLPETKNDYSKQLILVIITSVFLVFLILMYRLGFRLNFNIIDVYTYREAYREANIPLSGYIVNWTAKVMLPFLLLYSVSKLHLIKSYFLFFFSICFVFLFFSFTGHKTYLFLAPMALGAYFILRTKHVFYTLLLIIFSIVIISLFAFVFANEILPISLFVRRTMFIPAQVSAYYYEFFYDNYIYLSNSIFSGLIPYSFGQNPSNIIADKYFSDNVVSANNGIFADGFINFGIVGVIVWSIFFVLILKISDAITFNKNKFVLWPFLLISFNSMVNGAFFTSLLTHGVLLSLLICFLFPKKKINGNT